MGTDMPSRAAALRPRFIALALRDPEGSPLQRLQIIKGWIDGDDQAHYKVFDVAGTDGTSGTINLETGEWISMRLNRATTTCARSRCHRCAGAGANASICPSAIAQSNATTTPRKSFRNWLGHRRSGICRKIYRSYWAWLGNRGTDNVFLLNFRSWPKADIEPLEAATKNPRHKRATVPTTNSNIQQHSATKLTSENRPGPASQLLWFVAENCAE